MTSFDLHTVVSELTPSLKGAQVDNIYHLNPSTIMMSFRKPELSLVIEAGRRVHLTSYRVEKPPYPSPICRALRKHLRRGVVDEVRLHEFERIVELRIATEEGAYKLFAEVFGKGNIILVDDEGRIVHALSYRKMRDRTVMRGERFEYPPTRGLNPLKVRREQLGFIRKEGVEVVKALANLLNLGGLYAEEVVKKSSVDKRKACDRLTDDELDRLFLALQGLISHLTVGEALHYIVADAEERWIDVLPFPLSVYSGFAQTQYPTFNEAADDYYTKLATEGTVAAAVVEVDQQIQELERILRQQQEHLKRLQESLQENQRAGDAIYSHLEQLQSIIQVILKERRSGKEWDEIVSKLKEAGADTVAPVGLLKSVDPNQGMVTLELSGLPLKLSLRETVQQSAARFYQKARQAKEKIRGLEEAIAQTTDKLKSIQTRRAEAELYARQPLKRRKRAWYEKFHWSYSSEGFLMIGGRDAATNGLLINRHMEPNDIVFHADVPGSPFLLIKTGGKTPSESTITEAAQMVASYSRAWREGLKSVNVYWVKPDQIGRAAPSGEYLPRGSFMVYGPRNYVRNIPLRIAIGLKRADEQVVVLGGPPSAVASQTPLFVELVPGAEKSGTLAKKALLKLTDRAPEELKDVIRKLPPDELQRVIPSGGGEISIN